MASTTRTVAIFIRSRLDPLVYTMTEATLQQLTTDFEQFTRGGAAPAIKGGTYEVQWGREPRKLELDFREVQSISPAAPAAADPD